MGIINELARLKFNHAEVDATLDHLSTIPGFSVDSTMIGNAWVSSQIEKAQYKGSFHPFGEDKGILYAYDVESDVMWIKKV